jgi:hypothetical protein
VLVHLALRLLAIGTQRRPSWQELPERLEMSVQAHWPSPTCDTAGHAAVITGANDGIDE